MLLQITSTTVPATDLGFLLHKHPDRVQAFPLTFGQGTVFWPEATPERATAALFVEVDVVDLSRRRGHDDARPLEPYVNDRPYSASSLLSVAIAEILGTALAGQCRHRPELIDRPLALEAKIPAIAARGGERLLRALFEPLGYEVEAEPLSLGDLGRGEPERGNHFALTLRATRPVHELLGHLYVLVPVLDDDKHYWVGDDEVAKLLRHGEGWLGDHPERELIARRYLKHRAGLARAALSQLVEPAPVEEPEDELEARVSLQETRMGAVVERVRALGGGSVLDLGCGEGRLVKRLLAERSVSVVTGVDVSARTLEVAHRRLGVDRLPESLRAKVRLLHGSALYRDARFAGFDIATCVEVIEHLDPWRLDDFVAVLFGDARPRAVVLTTPNAEYNVRYKNVGRFRHSDHRFEWTRAELAAWTQSVAATHGYAAEFFPVGDEDPEVGPPTQGVVFRRGDR